jgi:hypothetical protein
MVEPALLMKTSIGPRAASATGIQSVQRAESLKSAATTWVLVPTAAASSSSNGRRRATSVSALPGLANSRASAAPMPDEAPVMATCIRTSWALGYHETAGSCQARRLPFCLASSERAGL